MGSGVKGGSSVVCVSGGGGGSVMDSSLRSREKAGQTKQ